MTTIFILHTTVVLNTFIYFSFWNLLIEIDNDNLVAYVRNVRSRDQVHNLVKVFFMHFQQFMMGKANELKQKFKQKTHLAVVLVSEVLHSKNNSLDNDYSSPVTSKYI